MSLDDFELSWLSTNFREYNYWLISINYAIIITFEWIGLEYRAIALFHITLAQGIISGIIFVIRGQGQYVRSRSRSISVKTCAKIITIIYPQDRFNQISFGRFLVVPAWTADSCHLLYV